MGKTLKKGLSVFLVVAMFFSCVPLGSLSSIDFSGLFAVKTNAISGASYDKEIVKYVSSVSKQSEVSSGYIGIYTADDLYNIRKNPSGKYMLMNDINLLGFGEWTSFIVNNLTLEGNGFSICNLYSETYGLFTESHGTSTIKNLGLENITINSTKGEVGGFVGKVEYTDGGTLNIENCFVTGYIKGGYCTGGFVGSAYWNDGLKISNCYNFADITGDSSKIGGVVGQISSWQYDTNIVESSLNRGTIKGNSSVGGIVGYISGYGDRVDNLINQCCNYGVVTGTKDNVGGICGTQTNTYSSVDITDCYNTGLVSGSSGVGGICGKSDSWIARCYNVGYVSGDSNVDALVGLGSSDDGNCYVRDSYYPNTLRSKYGTGLSPANMKTIICFNNFDFSSVWGISSSVNLGYPYLRALNNLKWAYDVETFNEVKKTYGSFGVVVEDGAGNPVTGAKVSIYNGRDGTEVIASTESINGVAKFPGFDVENNKNATVSAHWDVGNNIDLCSETVSSDGVWQGKTVDALIKSNKTLVVDEPRWYLQISVGYTGKTENERKERYNHIKSVFESYVQKFAEMTNGHCLITDVTINYYSSDTKMLKKLSSGEINVNAFHEFYILDDASSFSGTASTYSKKLSPEGYGFSSYKYEGFAVFDYNNGYFTDNTLCHESGHLFFGLWDEYCSGYGYDYDYDGDGKEEENAGKWTTSGGKIPRPKFGDKKAPSNFGVMDNEKSGNIELSNDYSYSYLYGITFDPSHPEWYTQHYYKFEEPTEKTVANYLSSMVNNVTDYTTSSNPTDYTTSDNVQKAKYSYSKIIIDGYSASSDLINSPLEEIEKINSVKNQGSILFDYNDSTIIGQCADSENISVYIECAGDIEEIAIDNGEFRLPVFETGDRLIVVKDEEGILSKEVYSILNDNGTIGIVADMDITYDEYVPAGNAIIILNTNDKPYEISRSLVSKNDFNYENTFWYCIDENGQYNKLDTNITYGEYTEIIYSCNVISTGTYVLMSTPAVEKTEKTISNFKVSNDTKGDGIVNISFEDSSDENYMYIIYYSMSPIEDIQSDDVSYIVANDTEDITLYVNETGNYYFTVKSKSFDGSYTWYNDITTFNYKQNDSNKDGIPDVWFEDYYMIDDSNTVASEDADEDGLTNLQEYNLGTNPINPDTDGDNVLDNIELQNSLNPLEKCSDRVTNDYIVVYGNPDLKLKNVTFNETDLTFSVENLSEGKAMRTYISLEVDGEVKEAWRVNADSRSSFDFNVPLDEISGCESLAIKVDENQITNDSDYSNNTFIYSPSSSIAFEKEAFEELKGKDIVPTLVLEPDTANEIFAWSIEGSPNLLIDSSTGVVTSNGIGTGKVTVKTLRGLTATCDVYSIAFEGAEYSEFDSKLINNDTEVAITGYIGDDSSIIIPETIGSLPVTQLASNAFKGCTFNEVTIHSGINSIANNTFSDTISLERIIVDEDNTSYCSVDGILYTEDKTQLVRYPSAKTDTTFIIPETVISIGAYSVYDCDYIEEITVLENVANIGNSAISNCNNLKTVNYNAISCSTPSGFSALLYGVFNSSNQIEKVIIGDNVKVIPQYLFYNRSNLFEVITPDNSNLLTIAQCAFYGCSKLTKFEIPETVTTIGSSAFYGCSKLEGIVLPESLTSISSSTFSGCSSLASIKIPETVKTIDASAFYGCGKLKDVALPETLTTIGTSAFSGCSSLTSIEIPETVTSIPNNCFANCTSLEKIVIPAQVDTIGETSFSGCSNVVIWCYYKSVAHEYAIANSISYKVMELDTEDLIVTGVQETIVEGLQYQITTEISPVDSDETVMYSSSDDNIFSVTDTGLITAKGAGEAILTVASSRGSVSKTFNINVLGLVKDSENANLYHVRNADDMLALSTMVNSGVSFAGKIIQLDNDIDLSNIDWTPIGVDSTNVFSGVFDGKNHTITGLNYSTTSNTYSGLFGYIKTGGVKDLTVEGSVSGISRVGMIAGCIFDSVLYNCKAIGEVKRIALGSYGYVGGLVGSALHSVIINCAAETDITVDFGDSSINYAAVGGIVGAASTAGSDPMCILNSYCIGDISVSGNSYAYENYYVGGIAGYLKDDAANNYYFGEITNADGDTIKRIGYAFGYVVPEYTSESDYNGIGTIIVQDNYYLEGKNAIGLISEGDYDSSNWVSPISEENFSKLIGKGSLVDELNGNKGSVEDIIVAHRDILSNSTWAELVDRINGDSFTVSNWKIGSNNLPVNYECDCYRHAESDWVVDVEATCTKEGSKHTYCLVCQETVNTSIIEKAEHKFSDWTETKAATCTEKGSEYRTCTTCNSATETRDIAKLGPNFVGEWTTDKAPTCTKNGVESRICTRCKSEKETRTIDKLGHDFESKWTVDKEATCSKAGSKSHHCSRCDEKSDVTVVNKIAHTYRESVQEATCTKDGKKTYNCSACGDSYSEVITAKGHIDQNGDEKCDNCDYIYDNTCDHMCHKSGFMGFIWKIVRFFWKLFKMNPVCECGIAHY